jgi:hypothetical protein
MLIKRHRLIFSLLIFLIADSCVVEYIPKTEEEEEFLVVEGLITDQPGINTIKLSRSLPLWKIQKAKPLKNCIVTISDDFGHIYNLKETTDGSYVTDSATFQGIIGRVYSLHITTTSDSVNYSYSSLPMEMKAVPPIDSIYYDKRTFTTWPQPVEGCEIFLDTRDPLNKCKFYRWDYSETWEFHLPFNVTNRVCWLSGKSNGISIRNTSVLSEDRTVRYLINRIKNPIDRLSVKYSLLVNQYSLNEDEYLYWERFKNILDQVGGLYDKIPAIIPNNIFCVEDPNKTVLGYFSVSAKTSKRIFIKDSFAGFDVQYMDCVTDSIFGTDPIPGLNSTVWILIDHSNRIPPTRYVTCKIGCADCRVRGTNIKPAFWDDNK